jgi:hypothetical protein
MFNRIGKLRKILLLEPNRDQAVAIAKYLKIKSKNSHITALFQTKPSFIFKKRYYDKIIVDNLNNIDLSKYDLTIPTGSSSTYQLLNKRKQIIIGDIEFKKSNLIVFDKLQFLEIVKSLDIPIPQTYKNKDDIDKFPVFYKEISEKNGGGRGKIVNKTDLDLLKNNKKIFFQDYIDSPYTFGVGFISKNGDLISFFIHKEILSSPITGGSGVILQQIMNKTLIDYTTKILNKIRYSGWGLAEFKYCPKQKTYVFMELNAKFWASLEFAFLNNQNFLKHLFNIEYKPKNTTTMIYLNRFLGVGCKNTFSYLLRYFYKSKIINTKLFFFQLLSKIKPKFFI